MFLNISERNSSSDAFGLSFGQCNEAQPSGMPDELGRIKVDGNNEQTNHGVRKMTDYMNTPLKKLVKDIVADGVVDKAEIAGMRKRLYADGVIDHEEAETSVIAVLFIASCPTSTLSLTLTVRGKV